VQTHGIFVEALSTDKSQVDDRCVWSARNNFSMFYLRQVMVLFSSMHQEAADTSIKTFESGSVGVESAAFYRVFSSYSLSPFILLGASVSRFAKISHRMSGLFPLKVYSKPLVWLGVLIGR